MGKEWSLGLEGDASALGDEQDVDEEKMVTALRVIRLTQGYCAV
jgi:hypothetical protein